MSIPDTVPTLPINGYDAGGETEDEGEDVSTRAIQHLHTGQRKVNAWFDEISKQIDDFLPPVTIPRKTQQRYLSALEKRKTLLEGPATKKFNEENLILAAELQVTKQKVFVQNVDYMILNTTALGLRLNENSMFRQKVHLYPRQKDWRNALLLFSPKDYETERRIHLTYEQFNNKNLFQEFPPAPSSLPPIPLPPSSSPNSANKRKQGSEHSKAFSPPSELAKKAFDLPVRPVQAEDMMIDIGTPEPLVVLDIRSLSEKAKSIDAILSKYVTEDAQLKPFLPFAQLPGPFSTHPHPNQSIYFSLSAPNGYAWLDPHWPNLPRDALQGVLDAHQDSPDELVVALGITSRQVLPLAQSMVFQGIFSDSIEKHSNAESYYQSQLRQWTDLKNKATEGSRMSVSGVESWNKAFLMFETLRLKFRNPALARWLVQTYPKRLHLISDPVADGWTFEMPDTFERMVDYKLDQIEDRMQKKRQEEKETIDEFTNKADVVRQLLASPTDDPLDVAALLENIRKLDSQPRRKNVPTALMLYENKDALNEFVAKRIGSIQLVFKTEMKLLQTEKTKREEQLVAYLYRLRNAVVKLGQHQNYMGIFLEAVRNEIMSDAEHFDVVHHVSPLVKMDSAYIIAHIFP